MMSILRNLPTPSCDIAIIAYILIEVLVYRVLENQEKAKYRIAATLIITLKTSMVDKYFSENANCF